MPSRRLFLKQGMAAAAWGLCARAGLPGPRILDPVAQRFLADPDNPTAPIIPINHSGPGFVIGGLPFLANWTGDAFPNASIPFHSCENCFPGGQPPAPTDEIDIAIVGGGLSGLTTAYLLREKRPVLFELQPRFGGVAKGERWNNANFSMGSAYVITPDPGTFLNSFYRQLGLHRVREESFPPDPIELAGTIERDFWSGANDTPQNTEAYIRYAEAVCDVAENEYPDIPLPEGEDNQWILDLDRVTLKDDIEARMGMPMPPLLASAVQAYCYSSFAAGAEEISAAAGWNFLAAEEFGRWVFPGGIAWMVQQLWQRLDARNRHRPAHEATRLRAGQRVVDVRLVPDGRAQVTWREANGSFRSLLARTVVMACPKHIARNVIHDLQTLDPQKYDATTTLETRAYVVANVLINGPLADDQFYDVFMLRDGNFPLSEAQAAQDPRIIDILNGQFARQNTDDVSVLTLYWPLPYARSRGDLIVPDSMTNMFQRAAQQISEIIAIMGVPAERVRQVRMARWGHAVPIARPGLIANATTEFLRRPIDDTIFFVNQDNWALPAVENCLLDAEHYAEQIRRSL